MKSIKKCFLTSIFIFIFCLAVSFRNNNVSRYHPKWNNIPIVDRVEDYSYSEENISQEVEQFFEEPMGSAANKRVLIVANFRTGSSFLGDIIQSFEEVFYSYEPLHFLNINPGSKKELLRSVFYCQFPAAYLQYINGVNGSGVYSMMRNLRAWEACKHNQTLCYQPGFIDKLCSTFPINVIKVCRLRVKELAKLLEEDPNTKDWKIVYLMRDPRGIMASRKNVKWCQVNPTCNNVATLCQDMLDDLKLIKNLEIQDPEHHYLVKFEDLTADVDLEVEKLFKFLEIPITDSVRQFLLSHTRVNSTSMENIEPNDEFSTIKDSKSIALAWQRKLSSRAITNIVKVCKPVFNLLGYKA